METHCNICYPSYSDFNYVRFFPINADPNCLSCQILVNAVSHFSPPSGPQPRISLYPDQFRGKTASIGILTPDEGIASRIEFYANSDNDAKSIRQYIGRYFHSVYINRDLEAQPTGKTSLQQILEWNKTCRSSHSECQNAHSPSLVPTRVINVGKTDGQCRLYESSNECENYMTLSHCWGKLKILTTTKDNLQQHKNHINFNSLPKTFQDAIQVTRQMGVRYLWIDSLCIIQDDIDDWARESSKMASIYRNSYLTLAATAAQDGSEGLFKPRKADTWKFKLPKHRPWEHSATLLARWGRQHDCLQGGAKDSWKMDSSEPLMSRAWVYQERLLSRRLLHFASDEMVWECEETSLCECGLVPRIETAKASSNGKNISNEMNMSDKSVFELLIAGSQRGTDAEIQNWYRLIRNYTMLSITRDDDRLPAFSGIASTLIATDSYMAGNPGYEKSMQPQTYQAPSWSWTSLIGGIGHFTAMYNSAPTEWYSAKSQVTAEVIDMYTTKSTPDPFGRVQEAKITLRGYCMEAKVFEKDKKDVIGSEWGAHRLRIEIPSLPATMWPYELVIDTMEDTYSALKVSISVFAMWAGEWNFSSSF